MNENAAEPRKSASNSLRFTSDESPTTNDEIFPTNDEITCQIFPKILLPMCLCPSATLSLSPIPELFSLEITPKKVTKKLQKVTQNTPKSCKKVRKSAKKVTTFCLFSTVQQCPEWIFSPKTKLFPKKRKKKSPKTPKIQNQKHPEPTLRSKKNRILNIINNH